MQMPGCISCGENPAITAQSLQHYDYSAFTGAPSNDAAPEPLQLLRDEERVSAAEDPCAREGEGAAAAAAAAEAAPSTRMRVMPKL